MKIRNSALIDPDKGVFTVLKLVALRLTGPYLWHSEDINEETAQGAVFRVYDPENAKVGGLDVASITVVDATNDPTESDISTLHQPDIPALDKFLHEEISKQLSADGMVMIQWMSSQLNQSDHFKGLVTAYVARDQGKERQFIALHFKAKGRKVVAIGVFDIAKKEVLAAPIFNVMRNMAVLA
jgi:hypothetical protein